jgi:hypothetical protein
MKTFLSHTLVAWMAILLIALAVALSSCSRESAPLIPALEKSQLPFPATPDQLMANFAQAYGDQNLAEYAALLHPDFVYELTQGSVPQTWGRDQELAITARMFSREDWVKSGLTIAGISRIEIVRFAGRGPWSPGADGGAAEAEHDLVRTYEVLLRFHRTDDSVITVRGPVVFQVRLDDLDTGEGGMRPGYRLVRQIDRTG